MKERDEPPTSVLIQRSRLAHRPPAVRRKRILLGRATVLNSERPDLN